MKAKRTTVRVGYHVPRVSEILINSFRIIVVALVIGAFTTVVHEVVTAIITH